MALTGMDGVGRVLARATGLFAAAWLAGCAGTGSSGGMQTSATRPTLDQVAAEFRGLSGWVEDDHAPALAAFQRSCGWMRGQAADRPIGQAGRVADWRPACDAARGLPAGDTETARRFFEAHFTPVALGSGTEGLFTGYYEIELNGSWTRTERFNVPIYRVPPRARNKPLPTRARIEAGALRGKGYELMWVDDPVDAFFLEIQGSGRVRMADGSVVGLHYAGQNGHAYYPIGRYLIDQGVATAQEVTLQRIRQWLKENPGKARQVMNLNPSYVFFKQRGDVGARGALNTQLVPGRSLAVDPSHVPLGVPLWLELKEAPVPGGELKRIVVAQDTGGAIKGPVRGDLFWGPGTDAAEAAGVMKARGRYTMLVPRTVPASFTTAQNRS